MMNKQHFVKVDRESSLFSCHGDWTLSNLKAIQTELDISIKRANKSITLQGNDISKMDSAGAWLIANQIKQLTKHDIKSELVHFNEQHEQLLALANEQLNKNNVIPEVRNLNMIQTLGKNNIEQFSELKDFLNFIGKLSIDSLGSLINPFRFRWNSVMSIINKTGTSALPIIALLSFMIGIVISYQMGNQLRNYGANIFIVNLLGLSVLREFGPLITAIMIAGRTGSAFTAEIGIMKINQEIDALNTMGVSSNSLLILPRILGLFIAMPLLTVWADIFGIIGGMVMAQNMLDVSWFDFLRRFKETIPLRAFIIGLGKAPLFALIIAGVGCFQGMKVRGSAESVGTRTTKSVVIAIFLIVIVDAFLSVLLSKFKL